MNHTGGNDAELRERCQIIQSDDYASEVPAHLYPLGDMKRLGLK